MHGHLLIAPAAARAAVPRAEEAGFRAGPAGKAASLSGDGARRAVDCTLAAIAAAGVLVWPGALLALLLLCWRRTTLQSTPRVGLGGRLFGEYGLVVPEGRLGGLLRLTGGHRLPVLLNVLCGDMALVGPRPAAPGELDLSDPRARRRLEVRPGLVSLWWLRRRASIAYDDELIADLEYVAGRSPWGDLGILLRAGLALLYGDPGAAATGRLAVLGVRVDNLTMVEAVDALAQRLRRDGPTQVCFVNADCLNKACRTPAYRRVLGQADLCLADGIGMRLAGRLLGSAVRQNVNGTDLFPRLCRLLERERVGLFLLGARPGVAAAAAQWIAGACPGLRVSGVRDGYFRPEEEDEVVRQVARSGAAVLLVAMGAPRQDLWIHEHLDRLGVKVAMGVGGLLDFYSGRIPRAPLWMREIGLEWLFRFLQEPRRMWRRYFVGNAEFLLRVLVERLRRGRAALRSEPATSAALPAVAPGRSGTLEKASGARE
ncbi:MAG: WecB/TagA/CpsF family glycosyltransferase [Candidatus Latescibacterota bacterium]